MLKNILKKCSNSSRLNSCVCFFMCFSLILSYSEMKASELESNTKGQFIELVFSEDELKEMNKWKDKTIDEMIVDAMNGDRAALYLVGMSFLTGMIDQTIDVGSADMFLEMSASLGFAPAIEQMIHKYIEKENMHLVVVYCNLLTSFGHKEFVISYHELRKRVNDELGAGVSKEIERVAASKKELIILNQNELKNSIDKARFVVDKLIINRKLITSEDAFLNNKYWYGFSKFSVNAQQEAEKFNFVLRQGVVDFSNKYEVSSLNYNRVLDMLVNGEDITGIQASILSQTKASIVSLEDFKISMSEFCGSSNPKIKKLAKEFCLLCDYGGGMLNQHYEFFLSPNQFLKSDLGVDKLSDYSLKFQSQYLYIQKIIPELLNQNNQGQIIKD